VKFNGWRSNDNEKPMQTVHLAKDEIDKSASGFLIF